MPRRSVQSNANIGIQITPLSGITEKLYRLAHMGDCIVYSDGRVNAIRDGNLAWAITPNYGLTRSLKRDGEYIVAVSSEDVALLTTDGIVQSIISVKNFFEIKGDVNSASWHGNKVAIGTSRGAYLIVLTDEGNMCFPLLKTAAPVNAVQFSPDGKLLVVDMPGDGISLFDVQTKTCFWAPDGVTEFAFGNSALALAGKGWVQLVQMTRMETQNTPFFLPYQYDFDLNAYGKFPKPFTKSFAKRIAVCNHGLVIAIVDGHLMAFRQDGRDLKCVYVERIAEDDSDVTALSVSPDGNDVAICIKRDGQYTIGCIADIVQVIEQLAIQANNGKSSKKTVNSKRTKTTTSTTQPDTQSYVIPPERALMVVQRALMVVQNNSQHNEVANPSERTNHPTSDELLKRFDYKRIQSAWRSLAPSAIRCVNTLNTTHICPYAYLLYDFLQNSMLVLIDTPNGIKRRVSNTDGIVIVATKTMRQFNGIVSSANKKKRQVRTK